MYRCLNLQGLAQAVAYGLVVEPTRRDTPEYQLVYSCMNWGMNLWRDWVVYRTAPGADLDNILLVNIAAYRNLKLPAEFLDRLLVELQILART